MKKSRIPKQITILILTLLTTILWVGLDIYRTLTIKPTTPVSESISKPLIPMIDSETIQSIESSTYFSNSEIPPISVTPPTLPEPTSAATPAPTIRPESSPSASLEETES